MSKRLYLDVEGVRLCCVDFGGEGTPILLLHGLAGRGNEWHETAGWLTARYHVYALDQRGHGRSDKELQDYSREAYVNDVISVIEQLNLRSLILIGQSMGGQNAYLVAARRPDLVRALIVVEARTGTSPAVQQSIRNWLNGWPLPFPSLADARTFFGGDTLYAHTWLEMLEERPDGYWPQFFVDDMVRSVEDQATQDYREEWVRLQCPTLLIGGEKSFLSQDELREMAQLLPNADYVQIPGAGHDLHLSHAHEWRQIAESFLLQMPE